MANLLELPNANILQLPNNNDFELPGEDVLVPPLSSDGPANFVATAISDSQINLSWSAVGAFGWGQAWGTSWGTGSGVVYRLERRILGQSSYTLIATTASTVYSDTGLQPSTTYEYRLSAITSSGQSGYSYASATTDDAPYDGAPTAVGCVQLWYSSGANRANISALGIQNGDFMILHAARRGAGANITPPPGWQVGEYQHFSGAAFDVTVGWWWKWANNEPAELVVPSTGPTGDHPSAQMCVYRGVDPDNPIHTKNYELTINQNGHFVSTIVTSLNYLRHVAMGFNDSPTWSGQNATHYEASGAYGNLLVMPNGHNSIAIASKAFEVPGSFGGSFMWTNIGDGVGYHVALKPPPGAVSPPLAPQNLTATATGTSSIALAWNAVAGATSITIQRSLSSSGPFVTINTVPGTATSYNDTNLVPNTTYHYRVFASNVFGPGPHSSASATTQTEQPPITPGPDSYPLPPLPETYLVWLLGYVKLIVLATPSLSKKRALSIELDDVGRVRVQGDGKTQAGTMTVQCVFVGDHQACAQHLANLSRAVHLGLYLQLRDGSEVYTRTLVHGGRIIGNRWADGAIFYAIELIPYEAFWRDASDTPVELGL